MGRVILASVLLVVGFSIGYWVHLELPWSETATVLVLLTVAGAFGGLLYTMRDSGLDFPHYDPERPHVLNLGWVADGAYGIAGAYVVFLVLPTDSLDPSKLVGAKTVSPLVKLVALALVGGYGGRSLVDRALANIAKDVKEAKESAQAAREGVVQIQEVDTRALELIHRHLDEGEEPQDVKVVKAAIASASNAARLEIFKAARSVREANWKKNKPFMERTIPIFEALAETEGDEPFHRNHGQLGYALKDQEAAQSGDRAILQRAYDELSTAIELRDRHKISGFLMYEFNRAICGILLGRDPKQIERDIRAAAERKSLRRKIETIDPVTTWLAKHPVDLGGGQGV